MLTAECLAELTRDADLVEFIAYVGAVNREIGYRQAEDDMQRHWSAAVALVRRTLKQPTYAELQRRRGEAP